MKSSILEITEVEQSFRVGFWMKRVHVLKNVNLRVPGESIFGFLGANGAGKTTLIHLITGLRKPTSGRVRLLGLDTTSLQAKAKIGYLPERPYFHEHLTGEGLLHYFGALAGMPRSKVLSRIPQVLAVVGMSHARNVELKRYSKGMLQRIGIAQALLHDPEFLVLDEPMSGLDPMGRKEIKDLIVKLGAEGRTVFFSSHVIPDVEAICDQVALIQKGSIIGSGSIGQFLAQGPLQMEILFQGLRIQEPQNWPEFDSIRNYNQGHRVVVSSEVKAQVVLRKLLAEGAQILSVNPIRPTLESYFGESFYGNPSGAKK